MVGPKRQDFWPRINILEGKKNSKNLAMNVSSSKIGHDFSNKEFKKLTLEKKWSPKLIFSKEKRK